MYCLDGVHPTHNTGTCKGWIMKGQEYEMPSNSGRQRLNINGAMNVKNPTDILIDYTESVNAQSTQRLISKILSKNKNKKRNYFKRLYSEGRPHSYCSAIIKGLRFICERC